MSKQRLLVKIIKFLCEFLYYFKYLCILYAQVVVGRVFTNGPGDLCSIPSRVIPKTQKMVLDTSLLNTQQYEVRNKGKVEQSRERSSPLLSVVAIEKGAFWSPSTKGGQLYLLICTCVINRKQCWVKNILILTETNCLGIGRFGLVL